MYLIYKATNKPIKEILEMQQEQIEWLLYNINKDKEERVKEIEAILDVLKIYINPEMFNKEQKAKKDKEHKTVLDDVLKTQFKDKGLSDSELKKLEQIFN